MTNQTYLYSGLPEGENKMKYLSTFVLGTLFGGLIGASVALLLAPYSGEQLRTNIKTKADEGYIKLQDDWQNSRQELQSRMDKMSNELQRLSKRNQGISEPALDE
jgi:gas vesicle protein